MNPQQIVDASIAQRKYPILMKHPQHRKATISGYHRGDSGSIVNDPPGIPGQFEDHWVYNTDQEKYYAAMGYLPNNVEDASAYRLSMCGIDVVAPDPNYPRALYRMNSEGEMDSALAASEDQHIELMEQGWCETPAAAQEKEPQEEGEEGEEESEEEGEGAASELAADVPLPKRPVFDSKHGKKPLTYAERAKVLAQRRALLKG